MKTKLNQQPTEWISQVTDSAEKFAELAQTAIGNLTERQTEYVKAVLNAGTEQASTLSGSKDVQGAISAQTSFLRECQMLFVGHLRQTSEVLNEQREDFTAWWKESTGALWTPYLPPVAGKKTA